MSQYEARVVWQRGVAESADDFIRTAYSRGHQWHFDGGLSVPASSSPNIVPGYSVPDNVDPEEAFVAALSSCHMLFFLSIAAKRQLVINRYEDEAIGIMTLGEKGRAFISQVVLSPLVVFEGKEPVLLILEKMHDLAHKQCFIANSVRSEVVTRVRRATKTA